MILFFIFFIRNLHGQLLQFANETLPTFDGYGTIINKVNCDILNQQPADPFQNIFQNNHTGEITIRTSANSICETVPTIIFKKPRILGSISSDFQLNLSLNHNLLSNSGSFYFSVVSTINRTNLQIDELQIMVTSSYFTPTVGLINIYDDVNYRLQTAGNRKVFIEEFINDNFSKKIVNVFEIVRFLLNKSLLDKDDIMTDISIRGSFSNGSYETYLNYSFFDNQIYLYQYEQKNIGCGNSISEFYFNPTTPSLGDLQYLKYTKEESNLITMHFMINPGNTNKYRPCSGERIGYYNNGYHIKSRRDVRDYDYFPLDPALQTSFIIESSDSGIYDSSRTYLISRCFTIFLRRDYSLLTNSFTNLADQTQISHKIYICKQNIGVLQEEILVQSFNFVDSSSTSIFFQLYEKKRNSINQPNVYHFLGNLSMYDSSPIQLDLFFFVNKLFKAGKFQPNERISQMSKCLRFFSGMGQHMFAWMSFPNKSDITYPTICTIPGCILCDTAVCFICNISANWTLVNGTCFSNSVQTIIKMPINLKKKLSCLLKEENTSESSCLTAPLSIKTQTALNFISTPNIGMLLKISQLMCLVEDFMFYIYTNMTYGEEFQNFLYFMWNISIERWVPYSLSHFYYNIQDRYDNRTKLKDITSLPRLWTDLDEGSGFISNTRDYWLGSIPFTVITYFLFHLLFRILKKIQVRISDYFISFKWFEILFVNIFLQNLQLLAFRTFQQILSSEAPNSHNINMFYIANKIVCYSTFFCIVMTACAAQYILRILIGNNVQHAMDIVSYSNSTIWFLIFIQLTKITNGLIHASFYLDNIIKFPTLLGTQIFIFLVILYFRSKFRRKTMFTLMVYEYFLKIIVHVCLVFRTVLKFNQYDLKYYEEQMLGKIEMTIIWTIFGITACELLTVFIKESILVTSVSIENKLESISSTRNDKEIKKQLGKKRRSLTSEFLVILTKKRKMKKQKKDNDKSIKIKQSYCIIKQQNCIINKPSQQNVLQKKVLIEANRSPPKTNSITFKP